MSDSLLSTTNPDSISELFAADPMTISDDDLNRLIAEVRRRRNEFLSQEAAAAAKPKSTRTKAAAPTAETAAILDKPVSELTADELGI